MADGFFKTVGYISTKVKNINNSKKIINPTKEFIKSLDEGYNLARLEIKKTSTKTISRKKTIKKKKSSKKKK